MNHYDIILSQLRAVRGPRIRRGREGDDPGWTTFRWPESCSVWGWIFLSRKKTESVLQRHRAVQIAKDALGSRIYRYIDFFFYTKPEVLNWVRCMYMTRASLHCNERTVCPAVLYPGYSGTRHMSVLSRKTLALFQFGGSWLSTG